MSQQMTDRLAAAAEQVAMAVEQLEVERERRNVLVLDARREGMSYGEIAHAARVTRCRVVQVIAERA